MVVRVPNVIVPELARRQADQSLLGFVDIFGGCHPGEWLLGSLPENVIRHPHGRPPAKGCKELRLYQSSARRNSFALPVRPVFVESHADRSRFFLPPPVLRTFQSARIFLRPGHGLGYQCRAARRALHRLSAPAGPICLHVLPPHLQSQHLPPGTNDTSPSYQPARRLAP